MIPLFLPALRSEPCFAIRSFSEGWCSVLPVTAFLHNIFNNRIFVIHRFKMYLERYIGDIRLLCQKNRVKSLFVFVSVLSDRFSENSDIDLIVDIDSNDPLIYADYYFDLKFALEELFNRKVDLLETRALKNPFLIDNINQSKQLLHAS